MPFYLSVIISSQESCKELVCCHNFKSLFFHFNNCVVNFEQDQISKDNVTQQLTIEGSVQIIFVHTKLK